MYINSINGEKAKTREEIRVAIKETLGIDGDLLEEVTDKTYNKEDRDPYEDYINYIPDLDALEQY